MKPMLVLISGGTCAGKSSLFKTLQKPFDKRIATDHYVIVKTKKTKKEMTIGEEGETPWEEWRKEGEGSWEVLTEMEEEWPDPKNVNWEKILTLVKKELDQVSDVQKIIFVEGLHPLQNEELRNMADLKIYSHTDDDLRLILKISRSPWFKKIIGEPPRDPRNFGGTDPKNQLPFAFKAWWNGTIRAEKKWIIPTQKYADLIVDYNESADLPKNTQLVSVIADLYFNKPQEFEAKMKWIREQGLQKQGKEVFAKELKEDTESRRLDSLYELIKSIKQKKNRPLKIIADWDDCLQPVKPVAIYHYHPLSIPYEQFWKNFWERAIINPTSVGGDKLHEEYDGPEEEKIALAKFEAERQARKANPELYEGSFYVSEERFKASLTTLARDLLQAMKDDLVEKLVIITSYRKTTTDGPKVQKFLEQERDLKKNKILRTFGQFPNCKLELTEVEKNVEGRFRPYRWEIIQKNHPDFDVYMDDSARGVFSVARNFPQDKDKTYILPDYRCNRYVQTPNIYHIKTEVFNDLKDEDFTQAVQEYQQKHPELASRQAQQNQETKEESIGQQPYLYLALGIGICLLGVGVYWLLSKKNKKS